MDPLTHGLLGATYASLFKGKRVSMRMAAFLGAAGALAPDLDILIRSGSDALLNLRYHRHFTHSLFMAPLLSLPVAGFWWLFLKKHIHFTLAYFFTCMGMMTHGMLDSMTNYGTHLFWPLSNARESWSIISIIDPLFTLALIIGLIASLVRKSKAGVSCALIFAALYWAGGLYQREQATQTMLELAQQRGHKIERFEVKPSLANLLVWRTQYQLAGKGYIDAVRVSPLGDDRYYGGSVVKLFTPPATISPTQAQDLEDFSFFSDGWAATVPGEPNLVGDARFAMLPDQPGPLWAIRLKPDAPDEHVDFISTRERKDGDIKKLWLMIQGLELKE